MKSLYERILITGAAGMLGRELRSGLKPLTRRMRLSDRVDIGETAAHEDSIVCDLSDAAAVLQMVEGVDAIVHFGGERTEAPWESILASNICGSYNIFEAARKHRVRRVIYASSVHAIGYHELQSHIDANAPHRPDTLYGLSKCFVEDLGRLYWDKFGLESAHLRIFSSYPAPKDRRMLWSWLSFDDCVRLVTAALTAPTIGYTIAFGTSNNALCPFDNRLARHLAFHPQDSSESYRASVEAQSETPDPNALATRCLGGWFLDIRHPDDEAQR